MPADKYHMDIDTHTHKLCLDLTLSKPSCPATECYIYVLFRSPFSQALMLPLKYIPK